MTPQWLIVLIVVVVAIVVAAMVLAWRRRRGLPVLNPEARAAFVEYITAHPAARAFEERRSGVPDILANPERFFAVEIREKEHADVAQDARANGGRLTGPAVRRWIEENKAEMAAGLPPNY